MAIPPVSGNKGYISGAGSGTLQVDELAFWDGL